MRIIALVLLSSLLGKVGHRQPSMSPLWMPVAHQRFRCRFGRPALRAAHVSCRAMKTLLPPPPLPPPAVFAQAGSAPAQPAPQQSPDPAVERLRADLERARAALNDFAELSRYQQE